MDSFFERLAVRAATIDELLTDNFEVLPGQKTDADAAGRRLVAWCRSCASGDWGLFSRRLAADGLSLDLVLPRLATVRRKPEMSLPGWLSDAQWIKAAFDDPINDRTIERLHAVGEPQAFEHLIVPIVEAAEKSLWQDLPPDAAFNFTEDGRASLCLSLARRLSALCAPAWYSCFLDRMRVSVDGLGTDHSATATLDCVRYRDFVAQMRVSGLTQLFEAKPVLLRLIASVTRQWIETIHEFVTRLHRDLPRIRKELLLRPADIRVAHVAGSLGDLHNFGRSVQLVRFADGQTILYKPKDLRIDAAWLQLIERLNANSPPIDLRSARVIASDGYGWSEFIEHKDCLGRNEFESFFLRAGAWLCLFHIFGATDMHEENMIAAGAHPVPIDLEAMLQAAISGDANAVAPEKHAFELAARTIADSVTSTGLLPSYARTPENAIYGNSGLDNPQNETVEWHWENINTDAMKPVQLRRTTGLKNVPSFAGEQAVFGDYIDRLIAGYEAYAAFLIRCRTSIGADQLVGCFAGLPVRKLLRHTSYYSLLLGRLTDHRNMTDGAEWSAHLDFTTRLMDWDRPADPMWPLVKAEREALATLNIPHFVSPTDRDEIADAFGTRAANGFQPGLDRTRERFGKFDHEEAHWQSDVIRLSTSAVSRSTIRRASDPGPISSTRADPPDECDASTFIEKAAVVNRELSESAIRSGPGAAWIGLDWLGDSKVCQLSPLGADLYNGAPGISIFLAAYARLTGDETSADLARAGVSAMRHDLRSVSAARYARAHGIGGSLGMGSVAYALTVLSEMLNDGELLGDALTAASLFSDDLIAADKSFDVMAGAAGGILGLLKLFRATGRSDVLKRATKCGEHLLRSRQSAPERQHSSVGWMGKSLLNGMSHGAAGFGFALASLAKATGRQDFAELAAKCIVDENGTFSSSRGNWPDLRIGAAGEGEGFWPCQWCHGAGGIGLARIGTLRCWPTNSDVAGDWNEVLVSDIRRAICAVEQAWPYPIDSLCCGSLGNIELLNEAAQCSVGEGFQGLRGEASRRMMEIMATADARGDYLWTLGNKRFNLGLFRGLAGIGYTLLRLADSRIPNVLIWE